MDEDDFDEDELIVASFTMRQLVELKATEAAGVIEKLFAKDRIDLMVQGDWEDIQIGLGLKSERSTARPKFPLLPRLFQNFEAITPPQNEETPEVAKKSSSANKAKKKSKRKMEAKSRKKNRKK